MTLAAAVADTLLRQPLPDFRVQTSATMIGKTSRWFLMVGIITVAFGCDNVSWGGMELRLEGPPSDTLNPPSDSLQPGTQPTPELGRLLFAVTRQGDSALLVPIAAFSDSEPVPLPPGERGEEAAERLLEERLRPGIELTLFHQGVRAGTVVIRGPGEISREFCSPRAQTRGILELVPGAAEAERFLALEGPLGRERAYGTIPSPTETGAHRIAAQNLAGEALNQIGARWPGGLQNIRQDLQVVPLPESEAPAVVASFLFQDSLEVSDAPEDSYSLLILGEPGRNEWERTFTWFRPVNEEGKGSPRFFSHLDLDGDPAHEILLEVFGADSRWWAILDREGRGWRVAFQDPCGQPRAPGEVR
jgi:hypothetical protein